MRRHATIVCATAAAIAVLAALTTTATAGRLSTSNNLFRATWTPITFSSGGEGITIRCNLTVEGSFHYRSIVKASRVLIGYITKAAMGHPCTGGEAWTVNGVEVVLGSTIANTLPWHLSYEGFEGTLPNIGGIRYLNTPAFVSNVGGVLCLFQGNVQGIIKLTRGVGTSIVPDATVAMAKTSGGILCPGSGSFSLEEGAGNTITVLGSTASITITLI